MWDAEHGLYFDYDFVHKRVREYPFLSTFYPLWAGIATPEQAAQVVRNLPLFERAGGLQTSTRHTGDQWDPSAGRPCNGLRSKGSPLWIPGGRGPDFHAVSDNGGERV